MRRWIRRSLTGVVAGLWGAASSSGIAGLAFAQQWRWGEFAVRFLLIGLLYPLAWAVGESVGRRVQPQNPARLRRESGQDLVWPALRTGQIPSGADASRWATAIGDVNRDFTVAFVGVVGIGVVVTGLVAGAAVRTDPTDIGIWAVAGVVLAVAAAILWFGMRTRAALRQLRAQLPHTG